MCWNPSFRALTPITKLTLFDSALNEDAVHEELKQDSRVRLLIGDLTMQGIATELIEQRDIAVIHLASMVSGNTEESPMDAW